MLKFAKLHVTAELSLNFLGENIRNPRKILVCCDFVVKAITYKKNEYKGSKQKNVIMTRIIA